MTRIIKFITPRRWWDWPFGLMFWGLVASVIAYAVEYLVDGYADDPFVPHVLMTSAIAAPLILSGLVVFRHLDRLQQELQRLATTDDLTGLPNRRAFFQLVHDAGDGVLLMLDLDHFKRVNDTHGHAVGDQVLCAMADMMRATVRETDFLGRLGGEEFAVYLVGATAEEAAQIGDRLAAGCTHLADALTLRVTASIGAVHKRSSEDVSHAIRQADQALYAAKAAGRARLVFAGQGVQADPASAA